MLPLIYGNRQNTNINNIMKTGHAKGRSMKGEG
jgi:hypothetical protein